jgi:hypothetical protein
MPLTDVSIRNAKPTDRLQKLADGGGLYLAIFPTGGKSWRFKYRYGGKEKLLTFGQWPAMSLAAARKKRDEARRLLAEGIDPGAERQAERARREALAANTFEAVAREWIERHLSKKSQAYRERVVSQLERFVFPVIGERPIAELTAPDILEVVRRVEKLNILETAHRVRQVVGQVIRYAIATGRAQADPTPALRGALPPPPTKHMAAPDDPAKVGEILRALEAFQGTRRSSLLRSACCRMFSCVRGNCAPCDGLTLTWRPPNGASRRPKPERRMWCRSHAKRWRFCAI